MFGAFGGLVTKKQDFVQQTNHSLPTQL